MEWYNSQSEIEEKIESINGFHQLINERHVAGYKRKEKLMQYVIFGKYILDTCGNCGVISGLDLEQIDDFPDVLTYKDFQFLTNQYKRFNKDGKNIFITSSITSFLPEEKDVCPICNLGWKLKDLHNSIRVETKRDKFEYFHPKCNKIRVTEIQEKVFRSILKKAGFKHFTMSAIPNEYCPCNLCSDWFQVKTPFGNIKIGRRKRVDEIDYSDLGIGLEFKGEDVTKETGKYIHAWDNMLCEEYLHQMYNEVLKIKGE